MSLVIKIYNFNPNNWRINMTSVNVEHEYFTCQQVEDLALLKINKGAKKLLTSVDSKETIMSVLEKIKDTKTIKGVAVIYSDKYSGHHEYRQLLSNILETETTSTQRNVDLYRNAISQFLKTIHSYPLPIVSGMNGEIGPDTLGLNLAFDLRIVSNNTIFFSHNLELGFPPSSILSFYLVQSLGSPLATELMLTKNELKPEDLLELRLINKIVSTEDLESTCLHKLRRLVRIPKHALVEARSMLQPNIDEVLKHIDSGLKSSLRSIYKMKP
jgi:enoyl-CoA hydratase/carnithine racemase